MESKSENQVTALKAHLALNVRNVVRASSFTARCWVLSRARCAPVMPNLMCKTRLEPNAERGSV